MSTVLDAKYADASDGSAARPPAAADIPSDFITPDLLGGFTTDGAFGLALGTLNFRAILSCADIFLFDTDIAMPVQVQPTNNPAPEAKNVEVAHSGVISPNAGTWVPKVSVLDPPTQPTTLWAGSSVPVDFEIPNTVGKLMDAALMIEVRTGATAPTAGQMPPTTHWVESVESYLGSQMIERVVADDLLHESLLFLSDQELNTVAPLVNITTAGGYRSDTFAAATTNYRFYLPLWANSIITAQPYCKGFSSKWKFRINFAPSFFQSSGTAVSANAPTIVQLKLIIQEASLSPNEEAQLEALHRGKIEYRSIRRNKHITGTTLNFSSRPASEITEVMTEFANTDSAALLVYARPSGGIAQYPGSSRQTMYEIGLLDGRNTQLVPRVPGNYLEGFVMPWSVSTSSGISQTGTQLYLFPFCSNLGRVLETGEVMGGLQLTGNEKLVYINEASGSSTAQIHVVSYEYMRIAVNRNASALVFRA